MFHTEEPQPCTPRHEKEGFRKHGDRRHLWLSESEMHKLLKPNTSLGTFAGKFTMLRKEILQHLNAHADTKRQTSDCCSAFCRLVHKVVPPRSPNPHPPDSKEFFNDVHLSKTKIVGFTFMGCPKNHKETCTLLNPCDEYAYSIPHPYATLVP